MPTIRPRILKGAASHVGEHHGVGCSAHDPTEDTESRAGAAGVSDALTVAVPTIRPRILKAACGLNGCGSCCSCSAHDPTEDTESATASSRAVSSRQRCSAHDPTEDTERHRDAHVDGTCVRCSAHDPTEDTERRSGW